MRCAKVGGPPFVPPCHMTQPREHLQRANAVADAAVLVRTTGVVGQMQRILDASSWASILLSFFSFKNIDLH